MFRVICGLKKYTTEELLASVNGFCQDHVKAEKDYIVPNPQHIVLSSTDCSNRYNVSYCVKQNTTKVT